MKPSYPARRFQTLVVPLFMVASLTAWSAKASDTASDSISAAMCFGCHMAKNDSQLVPAITGRKASEIEIILNSYKNSTRQSDIMEIIAKGYTSEQIRVIAKYLSGLEGVK